MKSFTESIQSLISLVTQDPHMESAWLTTLAHMEHLAAEQVLGNISSSTPLEFVEEIKGHAADEYRHRDVILKLRPFPESLNGAYEDLRTRLRAIAETFVMGYFANPVLVKASSRFTAYVHGAITIEQFPFQIYSSYIQGTQSPQIREAMQMVLNDESGHIQLGKKFRDSLPEEDRMSLQQLQIIEKEMCLTMVSRMTDLVREFQNPERGTEISAKASTRLAWLIGERPSATLAWVQALGHSESTAALHMQHIFTSRDLNLPPQMPEHVNDEMRHAKLLHRAVLIDRRRWLAMDGYKNLERHLRHQLEKYLVRFFSTLMRELKDPDTLYLYGAWGLEMRVFKHYTDIMKWTDNVGVAQTISGLLADEAEHTKMVNTTLNDKNLLDPDILKFVRKTEEDLFEKMAQEVISMILIYDDMPGFAPPYQKAFVPAPIVRQQTSDSVTLRELQ